MWLYETEDNVKTGVIGSGLIAKAFLSVAGKLSGNEIVAIYSRNTANAQKAADMYGIKRVFSDIDDMLMCDDFDFVYIAIPNNLHFEYAKKALTAGKNVVLEKPFTVTANEAEELFSIAEKKGLYLFEAITNIHNPVMKHIEEFIFESGRIKSVKVAFTQRSSRYDDFLNGRIHPVFDPSMNGGVLMDLGVYNLHILNHLFSVPSALEYDKVIERGVDISGTVKLFYDTFTAECPISKSYTTENGVYIESDIGYVKCESKPNSLEEVTISKKGITSVYHSPGGAERLLPQWETFERIYRSSDYESMLRLKENTLGVCRMVDMALA